MTEENLVGAAFALPALALTLRIGYAMRKRVNEEAFTRLVVGLMLLSGASVLISAVTQ
jgi:uncharacterized membrane protein YfcA